MLALRWDLDKDGEGEAAYGAGGAYYRVIPTGPPDERDREWTVLIEADDEEGTVTKLGPFDDFEVAKLNAEQHNKEQAEAETLDGVSPDDFKESGE